jgi:hypothetical protein
MEIEITNSCTRRCANCTRFVGHHRKTYFMEVDFLEKSLDSLAGFPGKIGIMGGEPTLHPHFSQICELLKRRIKRSRCYLWTSGYKWDEYKKLIKETFGLVYYNDHADKTQSHQPMLLAIDEVVDDKNLMRELIDKCWVQERWSPSINPKGGFFCEVAAALDMLYEGPGGYPIEKGWWKKTPEQFLDQVNRYCLLCGGAIPLKGEFYICGKDLISPKNLDALLKLGSPKALDESYELFDKKITPEMMGEKRRKPWHYLGASRTRKAGLKLDEIWLMEDLHWAVRLSNRIRDLF